MSKENPYAKMEAESLKRFNMSLSEILSDKGEYFSAPEDQKIISLLRRTQKLIEDDTLHPDAWRQLMADGVAASRELLDGSFLPKPVARLLLPMLKKVFANTQMGDGTMLERIENAEATPEAHTFKDEAEYYKKLYSARYSSLGILSFNRVVREELT